MSTLKAADPYLSLDSNWKIVGDNPRRGTMYSASVSSTSAWNNSLSANRSPFDPLTYGTLPNVIGLQRGGELGITSVEGNIASLEGPMTGLGSHPCITTSGHRVPGQPGPPVFIEEDWIARIDFPVGPNPNPAPSSYGVDDNPYFVLLDPDATKSFPGHVNANAFPFLAHNWDGLRKFHRDQAWMCGFVCQGYISYWSTKWSNLPADLTYVNSWAPLASAQALSQQIEWWRFSYDPGLLVSQFDGQTKMSLAGSSQSTFSAGGWPPSCTYTLPAWAYNNPLPPQPFARIPIEESVVVAKSNHTTPQYVVYCPANTAVSSGGTVTYQPVTAVINLGALMGASFTYRFWHPDQVIDAPTLSGTASTAWTVNPPSAPYLGEHNEWVLLINTLL
jgi:hypothetical protein